MEFGFEVIDRAGVKHHGADALSRLSIIGAGDMDIDDEVPVLAIQQQSRKG